MRTTTAILSAALCLAAITAGANPVCPACGREASTADATVCAHCQTPLPRAPAEDAPKDAAPGGGTAAARPAPADAGELHGGAGAAYAALKAELETARRFERDEANPRPNMAFFHYRNALALAPLAKLVREADREAIAQGVRRALAAVVHAAERCPACGGKGKATIKPPDYGQGEGRIGSGGSLAQEIRCPLCRGLRTIPGYRDAAAATRLLAEGRREFETSHQAAGDRKIGYAFVPEALAATFTARERALVGSGYGVPCTACGWTGAVPCRDCDGAGWAKCDHAGCKDGWIVAKQQNNTYRRRHTSGRVNDAIPDVTVCPECGGVAKVLCGTCGGARLVPCKKCSGEGLAPLCRKCNGTGLCQCRKCHGSGKVMSTGRDKHEIDCPECQGLGETLCPQCQGLGRRGGY